MTEMVRLQKYMAQCGLASRRKAEELIRAGKVKVNGKVVSELGTKVDPANAKIEISSVPLKPKEKLVYFKIYKPRGVISACADTRETTVIDLVKELPYRLFPVGRLDKESEGLLILTNDGALADRLTHPRYEHEKEYEVVTRLPVRGAMLEAITKGGIDLEGEFSLPAKVILEGAKEFRIILKEGKKRQIRRMVEIYNNKVAALKRVRVKNILLGDLKPGEYRPLTASELKGLSI
jgi:23S rRNA pseudouridine2605 synthase/23S rRNA pseudouridine2604 synthase